MTNFSDIPVETRFYAVAHSAPDAIISANGEGNIIFWNRSAVKIFGWESHEMIGKSLTTIIPEEYRETHTHGMTRLYETGEERHIGSIVELEGLRKNGTIFPLELSLSVWIDETGERFFNGIIRDITERKDSERLQREYAEALEQRNQELYAYDRTIAHDLKNPLGLIATYAELLNMQHGNDLPNSSRDQLERIIHASKTMVEMMDQLLVLANLRDTHSITVSLDPREVLQIVLDRFANRFERDNFTVTVPERMPNIRAHRLWIEQVFMNLLGNAIKYIGKDNSAPQITVTAEKVGAMVRFEVIDNGLGIPDEAKGRLFEAFERAHHDQAGGSGVGLSIVKRIIQRLEGQIGVESELGQGSKFWFTVPAA